jgi:hypothetical protein
MSFFPKYHSVVLCLQGNKVNKIKPSRQQVGKITQWKATAQNTSKARNMDAFDRITFCRCHLASPRVIIFAYNKKIKK